MKRKLIACLCSMVGVVAMSSSYGQCQLEVPEGGIQLCAQSNSLANTANSITILNPSLIPSSFAGAYTVTIAYYDEWNYQCPEIVCPAATLSATSSAITIHLNNSDTLPDFFATSAIVYINMIPNGEGTSYFYHYYGYSCTAPLENRQPVAIKKQAMAAMNRRMLYDKGKQKR